MVISTLFSTSSLWFDASIVLGIFAFGNILFGHFEEHKPKLHRITKVLIVLIITLILSALWGRVAAFTFLSLPIAGAVYVHLHWLPKRGVNGWTGEPRERYYELVGYSPKPKK